MLLLAACNPEVADESAMIINISENQRYFTTEDGSPFFWLGDTGWLLFKKLNREDAKKYLEDRSQKGFNVIQVMVIHDIKDPINVYGDSAFYNGNVAQPLTTEGNDFSDPLQYDYWDHVDYMVDLADSLGLQMALVPIWGSNVKGGHVTREEAEDYAAWLAERYQNRDNIMWLNGGDIFGSDSLHIWNTIGVTLNKFDTNHLITFHPRGRMVSTDWFRNEPWMDFNMFQSGHRRYDQDDTERAYGEDNWKYVRADYTEDPIKPIIDGEPSYEGIPQGLHDTTQPYWNDDDMRRYAYWSVFAGAAGFTYGHSAVMQFYQPSDPEPAYGAKKYWQEALNDSGAIQMKHLKHLMLSRPYFERIPDQRLVHINQGERYDYAVATRTDNYAFAYIYTGRTMDITMGILNGAEVKASWYNPRDGKYTEIGNYKNAGIVQFDPPGEPENGNDWVLVLENHQ